MCLYYEGAPGVTPYLFAVENAALFLSPKILVSEAWWPQQLLNGDRAWLGPLESHRKPLGQDWAW